LGVGGEDLGHGLFKLSPRFDESLNFLHPIRRDRFDALLAPHHEGERAEGVSFISRAMASGLTAAAVSQRKRTGQQVGGNGEATKEFKLTEDCKR